MAVGLVLGLVVGVVVAGGALLAFVIVLHATGEVGWSYYAFTTTVIGLACAGIFLSALWNYEGEDAT